MCYSVFIAAAHERMSGNHYSNMKTTHTIDSFKVSSDEDAALEKLRASLLLRPPIRTKEDF